MQFPQFVSSELAAQIAGSISQLKQLSRSTSKSRFVKNPGKNVQLENRPSENTTGGGLNGNPFYDLLFRQAVNAKLTVVVISKNFTDFKDQFNAAVIANLA